MFEIGGRYANRQGPYEVLDLRGPKMLVKYDDGLEQELDVELQKRIIRNIDLERQRTEPYSGSEEARNRAYFKTLGFLSVRTTMIEAILPKKAVAGFSSTYRRVKGRQLSSAALGFYVHPDVNVDKWGVEMRLTFRASPSELSELDFGPQVSAVDDPARPGESYRINNNGFIWDLLGLGFELGPAQSPTQTEASIPSAYRVSLRDGIAKAS